MKLGFEVFAVEDEFAPMAGDSVCREPSIPTFSAWRLMWNLLSAHGYPGSDWEDVGKSQ
jgi:hypothetical protein